MEIWGRGPGANNPFPIPQSLIFYKLKWEGISLKYFIFFAGACPPLEGKRHL
jgi:hypothetical protein